MAGNPAKILKEVTDEMLAWKTKGTLLYQALPGECFESLQQVEPLHEKPSHAPSQERLFETWNSIKAKT
jgi:hypothetical protein